MTLPRKQWSLEEREKVREMIAAGATSTQVSAAIGRSQKAVIDTAAKYGLGKWQSRHAERSSRRRTMPIDFPEVAPGKTIQQLREIYPFPAAVITRWLREAGIVVVHIPPPVRPHPALPDDFAEVAPSLTMHQAKERYGRGEITLSRWAIEAGISFRAPPRSGVSRALKSPVDRHQVDMSRAAQAARFIQRKDAIWRCNEAGKQGPGKFWMLFGRPRTDAEIIERAERLGWNPDGWKQLATPIPTTTNEGPRA